MILITPSVKERSDKITASILGGAIGDALGAPLEGERDFARLQSIFGDRGVQTYVTPVSPNDNKLNFKPGDTTDDTACTLGVIAALEKAHDRTPTELLYHLWQAQMVWGSHQKGGENLIEFVDTAIQWQDWYKPFYHNVGAGSSTLGVLGTGKLGTPERPSNNNLGGGGMMRVAPIALLGLEKYEMIDLVMRSTALTHGSDEAQGAAITTALVIRNAFNGMSLSESAHGAVSTMIDQQLPGHQACNKAYVAAAWAKMTEPVSAKTANDLPKELGYENHFMAIPVLSQVLYGTLIASSAPNSIEARQNAFRQTLAHVATIAGDSDSTGAIVGNILGAAWGANALPADLVSGLRHKNHINAAINSLKRTVQEISHEIA